MRLTNARLKSSPPGQAIRAYSRYGCPGLVSTLSEDHIYNIDNHHLGAGNGHWTNQDRNSRGGDSGGWSVDHFCAEEGCSFDQIWKMVRSAEVGGASLANDNRYNAGWMMITNPDDWDIIKASLVDGANIAEPYEAKMNADGFEGCN